MLYLAVFCILPALSPGPRNSSYLICLSLARRNKLTTHEITMLCLFRTTARKAYCLHILLVYLPCFNAFLVTNGCSTRSRLGNNSKYVTKSIVSTPACCTKRGKRQYLPLFESVSPDESSSPSPSSKKKKRTSKKKSLISEDEVAIVKNMSTQTSSVDSAAEAQDRVAESKESKRLVWKPVGRVSHKGIPITLLDSPNYVTKGFPYGVVVEETEEDEAEDSQGDDSEIASFDQLFTQQSNDQQEQMELQRQKLEDEIYDKYEYYKPSPKDFDEDGIEILSSPIFGPYNPIDERAIVTPLESYMVAEHSKNENSTIPSTAVFLDDEEKAFQEEVRQIRKEMKRLDTYIDPHLQLPVPRNVRPWHGTVQEDKIPYEPKDFMNNRFTKPEDKTDFTKLDPYTARKTAVRLALMDNNEWLPAGVSEAYFEKVNFICTFLIFTFLFKIVLFCIRQLDYLLLLFFFFFFFSSNKMILL